MSRRPDLPAGDPEPTTRAAAKAARRAQNRAAFAAGIVLPRWAAGDRASARARRATAPEVVQEAAAQLAANRAAWAAANQAAWKAGQSLPRWVQGQRPGRTGPRSGPDPIPVGAQERAAARRQRAAERRAAWVAAQEQRRALAAVVREQQLYARRRADRARAADWHEQRRADREISGTDRDVLLSEDQAAGY